MGFSAPSVGRRTVEPSARGGATGRNRARRGPEDRTSDFLAGGADNDQLFDSVGKDYLDGESGNDTLDGGAGRDVLAGGEGEDTLQGGTEGDTFFGQGGADTFVTVGGRNWLTDFEPGTDRIAGTSFESSGAVHTAATQVGAHVHIELVGGGDLYLAWTTLGELAGQELI